MSQAGEKLTKKQVREAKRHAAEEARARALEEKFAERQDEIVERAAIDFPDETTHPGPVIGSPSSWHGVMENYVFPGAWMFRVICHFIAYHTGNMKDENAIVEELAKDMAAPFGEDGTRPCAAFEKYCARMKLVCGNVDPVFNPHFLNAALTFVRGTTYMEMRDVVYKSHELFPGGPEFSEEERAEKTRSADDYVKRCARTHVPVIGPMFKVDDEVCDFLTAYLRMAAGGRKMPMLAPNEGEYVVHDEKIAIWEDVDWNVVLAGEKDKERERQECEATAVKEGGGELTAAERSAARALTEEVEAAIRARVEKQRDAESLERYNLAPLVRDEVETIGTFNPGLVFNTQEEQRVVAEVLDLDHDDADWAEKAKAALTHRTRLDPEEARVFVDVLAPEYARYMLDPDVVEKGLTVDHIFAIQGNSEIFTKVVIPYAHAKHIPQLLRACSERIEYMLYNGRSVYDVAAFACNAICFLKPVRAFWKELAFGAASVILAAAGCTPAIPTLSFHNAIDEDRLAWKFVTDHHESFVGTLPTAHLSEYFRKTCRQARCWGSSQFPSGEKDQRVVLEPVAKKFYLLANDELYCKAWPSIRAFVADNFDPEDTDAWYTADELTAMEKPPFVLEPSGRVYSRPDEPGTGADTGAAEK